MPDESPKPLLNISDLAGIKEALVKLIETVSAGGGRVADGISRLTNAYLLASRDTRNEVENIQKVEGAKNQALAERLQMLAAISSGTPQQLKSLEVTGVEVSAHFAEVPTDIAKLQERANSRASYQNALHQVNLDGIIAAAAAALVEEPIVATKPVDQDWINRFFESAKLVSAEEMQVLWGNILAGEVKQPGSYSLRTLEVLKNLTQHEAQLFKLAANFTIHNHEVHMVPICRYGHNVIVTQSYGLTLNDFRALFDCGLLSSGELALRFHTGQPTSASDYAEIVDKVLIVDSEKPLDTTYGVYYYTKAGNELFKLTAKGASLSIPFLTELTAPMRAEEMRTRYATVSGYSPTGKPLHENLTELFD